MKKKRGVLHCGVWFFGLGWRLWCIYDALALCYLEDLLLVITLLVWRSISTCWRPCLDALVLEVSLEDLSLVRYTWRFLWLMHLEAWEVFVLVVFGD